MAGIKWIFLGIAGFILEVMAETYLFAWNVWAGATLPFLVVFLGWALSVRSVIKNNRKQDRLTELRISGVRLCLECFHNKKQYLVEATHDIEAVSLPRKGNPDSAYFLDLDMTGYVCEKHYEERKEKWLSQRVDGGWELG